MSISDARRDSERDLKDALAKLPETEHIESYVPAFCTFAAALFDAEAAELLDAGEEQEAFIRILAQDVAPRIIEGIMPDRGLQSVKARWSKEIAGLAIEQELGSEILLECRPDGTIAPARAEIQAANAQHGDWEKLAPPAVRFRLRFEKNALVRENLRQVLERRVAYWIGRFSLPPRSPSQSVLGNKLASDSEKVIEAPAQSVKPTKRRGRRRNEERRTAIHDAICRHGDDWRTHLTEIFEELDGKEVPLGDFHAVEVDVGDGQKPKAMTWTDLDLALGPQRNQIIDALRKYA